MWLRQPKWEFSWGLYKEGPQDFPLTKILKSYDFYFVISPGRNI